MRIIDGKLFKEMVITGATVLQAGADKQANANANANNAMKMLTIPFCAY